MKHLFYAIVHATQDTDVPAGFIHVSDMHATHQESSGVLRRLRLLDRWHNHMNNSPKRETAMPRWLPKVLARIKELATARRVRFTLKARRELALLGAGLDEDDACDALAKLVAEDSAGRLLSEVTGEWMYLFKPVLAAARLYIKVVLRSNCIVVSFHEDEGDGHEEDA